MENFLADDCHGELPEHPQGRVGLDFLDQLPFLSLPTRVVGDAMPHVLNAVNALSVDGPHGPAMRRLLSREVAVCRAELRFVEMVRNFEVRRFFDGEDNVRRVELAERLVTDQSRRLLSTIDVYARVSGGLPPRIHVSARNAVVAVGSPA